ncbi:hypothetical protein F2Q68_00015315 [Brassica cretica]|uniref:Uncharacterized protein n=1 Tax=Brassica cretica TaxID=69181 RepID=A0A8S9HES6_BRACR|nr:hypothetical protein F2Q68_00015315 [Brassica cretica]
MESFQKRVLRIPIEKPFEEAYFTHILWMFFRETRETEEDIRRMFCEAREKMKKRITLKKKSDPEKFAIPCTVKGIEFPHALCDTTASVNILPRIIAHQISIDILKEESVDSSPEDWKNDYYNPIVGVNNATPEIYDDLFDEEYMRK